MAGAKNIKKIGTSSTQGGTTDVYMDREGNIWDFHPKTEPADLPASNAAKAKHKGGVSKLRK